MSSAALAAIQLGGYINPWKLVPPILVLLIWVRVLTWIDKDVKTARLPREIINSAMLAGLVLGYLLFFILPGFAPALAALCGLFSISVTLYLALRARKIGLDDLTGKLKNFGAGLTKKSAPKEATAAAGQLLLLTNKGAAQPAPGSDSPDRMQYDAAQQLLTKPLRYGMERLDLTAGEMASVNYVVDGVRYEGDPLDRNKAGAAVQYLKRIAGLDLNERRKPQTGTFRTLLDNVRHEIQITTLGSSAGESMRLVSDPRSRHDFKLDTLGFSDEQLQLVQNLMIDTGGVVLLAAPPGHGLTSLAYAMIRGHDAFMYHVHTVERAPELELEGITQNKLPANVNPAEEAKQVEWVISQEPDVMLVGMVEDSRVAQDLARFASDARRVYVGMHAVNTFDAINQWRKLVGDDELAISQLKAVIAGRLVRRLCSACKMGYAPDPNQLRKLNMDPAVVTKLYAARKEPMRDAKGNVVPCTFCHDLAYTGRFGVYEVFVIDDEVRQIVRSGGSDNQIKTIFRKQQGQLLQELAVAHVRVGETSLEEVLRVLRGDAQRPAAHAAHR
jgi:type II secretory ATPase GspE/PulE/Tfp pilus assembly ATPase PilB-like protein